MNSTRYVASRRRRIFVRRLGLMFLTLATTAVASYGMFHVLLVNGFHWLEWPVLPLFVILALPISLSFWTAVFGFFVQLQGGDSISSARSQGPGVPADLAAFRTAIVIPAYNEDTVRLIAGLKATYESLANTGHLAHFDFFLLSDTTDPDIWIREEMAFHDLRQTVADPERLIYRNRRENSERKAGNIADFCATWGEAYRYMIVFDADSLMTGDCMVKLVGMMERNADVGIIQTPPVAVNRRSLFGRCLQFATRAYGPMFISGLNFWQAGDANYWGHNAIIRIKPFVEHCELPKLPGKEPLGGSILSHDFVEAALIRRAGWKVFVATELGGSYEEIPANLIGHAARDRRWCQGNLQHTRLLTMRGLNWVSRLHLAMGVMSYTASPLWMLMLLFSTADGLRTTFTGHDYFQGGPSPFPVWQVSIAGKAVLLLTSMLSMLLVPKILSLVVRLVKNHDNVAGFGGPWKLILSVFAETLVSVLIAPILAVLHSQFVISTLLGRKVKWLAQDRGDAETPWLIALRWHLGMTLLGVIWSVTLWKNDRVLFWWLLPVLAGWVLAVPISAWTSKVRVGEWARRRGLFLTPEEIWPSQILVSFHQNLAAVASRPWVAMKDGLDWVLDKPEARSVHLSLLQSDSNPKKDPLAEHRLEGLRLKARSHGKGVLKAAEKRELLCDAESIEALSGEQLAGEEFPQAASARV